MTHFDPQARAEAIRQIQREMLKQFLASWNSSEQPLPERLRVDAHHILSYGFELMLCRADYHDRFPVGPVLEKLCEELDQDVSVCLFDDVMINLKGMTAHELARIVASAEEEKAP